MMFDDRFKYVTAEISAGALVENIRLCRSLVGDSQVWVLIKADCYGHGLKLIWPVLAEYADGMVAATPGEAMTIREFGYDGPVLVLFPSGCEALSPDQADCVDELIRTDTHLTITCSAEADYLARRAARVGRPARIHIMVDSGMTRSGVLPCAAESLLTHVNADAHLKLTGIYTHLATADEADKSFAHQQLDTFDATLEKCCLTAGCGIMRHAANSPGLIELPRCRYDMVRLGLSLFGYHSSFDMENRLPLRPCLKLKSTIMHTSAVPAGSKCGYGCTYVCKRDTLIGLVPIGYADGYLRQFSNRASMIVRGQVVPVIGRVSMDQTILDLTDVSGAAAGDEAIIISNIASDKNSVERLAVIGDTIPQVVTSNLNPIRIRRVLTD
ncbi:MAG TPA: alanine racemase [Phycisphaerae bacterium]|nr:alanine racemase [Phycisphaerae bacterium]HPS53510.1 alanine racemase [Phycisphaerae bacterium]